jgi:hypothetical protein
MAQAYNDYYSRGAHRCFGRNVLGTFHTTQVFHCRKCLLDLESDQFFAEGRTCMQWNHTPASTHYPSSIDLKETYGLDLDIWEMSCTLGL